MPTIWTRLGNFPEADFLPGDVLAAMRLEHCEVVGVSAPVGMGEVYRVLDTKRRREVALKILLTKFASDPSRLVFSPARDTRQSLNLTSR